MKWLTAIVTACILALALASGSQRSWTWVNGPSRDPGAERRRVQFAQLIALRNASTEAHAQLAIARWRAASTQVGAGVTVDPALPTAVGEVVATAARAQIDSSGGTVGRGIHLHISRPLRAPDSAVAGAMRAPLGVTWVLPRDPGAPCRTLVEVRDLRPADVEVARHTSLLGPCAYFARFGMPGPRIRAWLDTARYSPAMRAPVAQTNSTLQTVGVTGTRADRRVLSMTGMSCLMGHDADCRRLLGLERSADSARVPGDPWTLNPGHPVDLVVGRLASTYGQRIGLTEGRLLADLVAMGGEERFARFWTSPVAVDTAFLAAYGEPMPRWMRRWLALTYDDTPGGPRVPASAVWSTIAMVILGLWWGTRGVGRAA